MFKTVLVSVLLISHIFAASWQSKKFGFKPRIIHGKDAQPGQFKYMASLREVEQLGDEYVNYKHFCGGAVISENWIITAAHCFTDELENTDNIRIVVGTNYIETDGLMYEVERVIKHIDYHNFLKDDISLLQTKSQITFGESIQPIEMAKKWIEPGSDVVGVGFGITEYDIYSSKLLFAETRVISNDECVERHIAKGQSSTIAYSIHHSTLCTFDETSGFYLADSGGPVVFNNQLCGIISWGSSVREKPDQSTRISEYIEWIEEISGVHAV